MFRIVQLLSLFAGLTLAQATSAAPTSISQNTNTTDITTGIDCGGDFVVTVLRRFDLDGEFGLAEFSVADVDFGYSSASTAGTFSVSLYTIPNGADLLLSNLTLLNTGSTPFLASGAPEKFNVPVAGVVDGTTDDLVVGISKGAAEKAFFAANSDGQSAPSYIQGCGIAEPTDLAEIGLGFVHILMVVNGEGPLPCPPDTSICTEGDKGKLGITELKNFKWAWKGPLAIGDIGNPTTDDELQFCLKVDGAPVQFANLPSGNGELKPGKKYRFKGNSEGITRLQVKDGGVIKVKGDGSNLPTLPLNAASEVEAVLASSTGKCFKSTFEVPLKKDDGDKVKAKTP